MLNAQDFTTLYASQAARLRTWTRRVLHDTYRRADADGEADDLTEDVWARLWELWDTFASVPQPAYLYSAAKHAMIDLYRRRRLIRWHSLDAPPAGCDRERERRGASEPGAWTLDTRDRIGAVETRLDLAEGLARLTPTERAAFTAFYVRDEAGQDTATGQAKMARLRARRRLQQCAPLAEYAPVRPQLAS